MKLLIAVAIAASALGERAHAFAEIARDASNPHGATVIGFGFKAAPAMAAFANGAMAHALDYEDTFDAALVHPNAAVVPAALALAESSAGVAGSDLLLAIAAGADLTCRLGLAIEGHERPGMGTRFMCGAFGATAGYGVVERSDRETCLHAGVGGVADDLVAEAVLYRAEVELVLAGPMFGDIGQP